MNEEKERYTWFGCGCCVDNQDNLNIVNCIERLNQQDKQIKALNTKLVEEMELSAERRQIIEDLTIENKQQFKRIRESEKEIERIKEINLYNKDLAQNSIRDVLVLIQENQQLKQSQKQLAIKELEKLRPLITRQAYICGGKATENEIVEANAYNRCLEDIRDILHNQIKQLEAQNEV